MWVIGILEPNWSFGKWYGQDTIILRTCWFFKGFLSYCTFPPVSVTTITLGENGVTACLKLSEGTVNVDYNLI